MNGNDRNERFRNAARQMSSISHTWEVFVFDEHLVYCGRICHRSKCPAHGTIQQLLKG